MILASSSPRRKELIKKITNDFCCITSNIDENIVGEPTYICVELAKRKALAVASSHLDEIVIGADTIVVIDNKILGKPKDVEENKQFLKMLSGKIHYVYTGFAVTKNGKILSNMEKTEVLFNDLSDKKIEEYASSLSGLDKAGGYGIQDGNLVKQIFGDYENVVGFPTTQIKELIDKL